MSLTGDPWIPVIYETGGHKLVSLNALYADAEKIRDLCVTPPQRIALMRLLVCITQRALDGPEDEQEWRGCRDLIGSRSIEYLHDHAGHFDLYGDRPFLQVRALETINNAVIDKLDFGLSAGNNSILFDHAADPNGRPHSPGWCALMLLTYQAFSPGGTIGETKWSGVSTGSNSEHATCVEGSMLHTIIRGKSLLDSIHLNLLTKRCVSECTPLIWGRPTWEIAPTSASDEAMMQSRTSYLARLVPLSRGILLSQTDLTMTLVNGLRYPKLPEAREPSGTVLLLKGKKPEKYSYLAMDVGRHPWRELSSLLTLADKNRPGGALALQHLDPTRQETVDVWTGGLAADKGKIIDVGEWTFCIPQSMLESSVLKRYQDGVELARRAEGALGNTVASYCDALNIEKKAKAGLRAEAATHFWSALDVSYAVLLQAANSPDAGLADSWYRIVRGAMHEAYLHACHHETPRQIQACAQGRQRLHLKKPE
jgi:CRISPR system Cascade subunit CasA